LVREKGESLASKLGDESEFVQVDIRDRNMLEEVLQDVDLVVHAAGPFQRENECTVLQAAIATKTAYIDVCDDTDYSWRAKGFHEQAKDCGIPAITTAGIYPGVSNGLTSHFYQTYQFTLIFFKLHCPDIIMCSFTMSISTHG
jgi:saccharopine dehydrogenase-like NADP-dependent oxidoreductase